MMERHLHISFNNRTYVLCTKHAESYGSALDLLIKSPFPITRKSDPCEACVRLGVIT